MSKQKKGPTARTFKMFWGFGKKYFISYTFMQAFEKFVPFFNLWISAEIITALYQGKEKKEVGILIVITLAGNLLIRALTALFQYFVNAQRRIMEDNEKKAFQDKVLSLDYDKMESSKIRDLRHKIITNAYINMYGPKCMIVYIERIIGYSMNLLYSMILFGEMFRSIIKAGFRTTSVIYFALIILGLVMNVYWSTYSNKKVAECWEQNGQKLLEGNRYGDGKPQNMKDVRIYKLIPYIEDCSLKYNKSFKETILHSNLQAFKYTTPSLFIGLVPSLFSYLLVCYYCRMGVFPIGAVIKYVGYLGYVINSTTAIVRCFTELKINRKFLETYLEFFDVKNDMYQGSLSVEKRSDKKFEVSFRNVSFKYPESDQYALKNINFDFQVGQRLAVVGMNGSGKTTLVKLLCRLYDVTEGEIIMNDFDIKKYDYNQYLSLFSVVFQDYSLLSFTLGQNIAANGTFDTQKAEYYLKKVGFEERYEKLPNKMNTYLYKDFDKEGVVVSGGEAQKIALTRALYKDAPFIILDEPTAALDPLSEAEIYSRFNDIVGDKSAIYISHRLSSCRFCDKILVLDKGEIVQCGSHDDVVQ